MGRPDNLIGQKFGRLLVISKAENRGRTVYWNCVCVCGKEKAVSGNSLKCGDTKSCGCFAKEVPSARVKDLTGEEYGRLTVMG